MTADPTIGLVGFGEAGRTFARSAGWGFGAVVYDRLTDDAGTARAMQAAYQAVGVAGRDSLAQAVSAADVVISLVTADQAAAVARDAAQALRPGALYLDLNSVAPETKRASARAIEAAGGRYADVAVMSPVEPAALKAPLLVSGPHADEAVAALLGLGFENVRAVGAEVGRASSIKMIRSVMIKGIEALSAECVLAAEAAGVLDEVIASLDASWPGAEWGPRADYNLDRMMVHGLRRAAEMEEVVRTLDDLGTGGVMSRGTVERQNAIGRLKLKIPPQGLTRKIAAITHPEARAA